MRDNEKWDYLVSRSRTKKKKKFEFLKIVGNESKQTEIWFSHTVRREIFLAARLLHMPLSDDEMIFYHANSQIPHIFTVCWCEEEVSLHFFTMESFAFHSFSFVFVEKYLEDKGNEKARGITIKNVDEILLHSLHHHHQQHCRLLFRMKRYFSCAAQWQCRNSTFFFSLFHRTNVVHFQTLIIVEAEEPRKWIEIHSLESLW